MPHERYERSLGRPWRRTQQYHQSIAPPWAMPQPAPQPAKPARPAIEVPPGATMTRDEYRQKDAGDLKPGLYWSAVLGVGASIPVGMLASLGMPVLDAARWGVSIGAVVGVVSFLAATFTTVWREGSQFKVLAECITHHDLDGDGRVGQEPTINLNAVLQEGQTSHNTNVRMLATQVRHWRNFCLAYTQGECNFSGNGAEAHGVDRALFNRVIERWVSQDARLTLIDPASIGERLKPQPNARGDAMIALYANTPLQELASVLEPFTRTDRQTADREE